MKLFNLLEHIEWQAQQNPFDTNNQLVWIYESSHIVNVFDKAIDSITVFLYKKISLNDLQRGITIKSNFFYSPLTNTCSKIETPGFLPIYIKTTDKFANNALMVAEPQSENYKNIIVTISCEQIERDYRKYKDQFKEHIHASLKHEFKHIRTIWARLDKDVLYQSKKYKNSTMTNQEAFSVINGLRIDVIEMIKYYLNDEECLAHINYLFDLYKSNKKQITDLYYQIFRESLNPTIGNSISKIIDYLDKNYYFSNLSKFINEYSLNIQNAINGEKFSLIKMYELYIIRFHMRRNRMFKDFVFGNNEIIPTSNLLKYEEFKKIDLNTVIEDSNSTLKLLNLTIGDMKRALGKAIYNDMFNITEKEFPYFMK